MENNIHVHFCSVIKQQTAVVAQMYVFKFFLSLKDLIDPLMINRIRNYMRLKNIIFYLLALIHYSCIDFFPLETPSDTRILTVDGRISTAAGPHLVSLSYAGSYTDIQRRWSVPGAVVSILDDLGNEITLEEEVLNERWFCESLEKGWQVMSTLNFQQLDIRTGKYYTPASFSAEVGRSYTLKVITPDQRVYVSNPEKVMAVPSIESVEIIPFKRATINPLIDIKGVEILVSFTDPSDENNFYFWSATSSYIQLITEPELFTLSGGDANCPRCLSPLDCCPSCFIPDMNIQKDFSVANDFIFNGLSTQQKVLTVIDDGIRFKSRYRFRLNQHAISSDAFLFLRMIKQQLEIQGSVFDPLPANIRGNMKSVDRPDEQVLGYFIASDVSSEMIYINREDIPPQFRTTSAIIPGDCRNYCGNQNSPPSLSPPDDWEWN